MIPSFESLDEKPGIPRQVMTVDPAVIPVDEPGSLGIGGDGRHDRRNEEDEEHRAERARLTMVLYTLVAGQEHHVICSVFSC